MAEYIDREAALDVVIDSYGESFTTDALRGIPAAEVVDKAQYDELLKAAKRMHTWIFLNTMDEQEVYDECGLTPEMNALLGSIGTIRVPVEEPEEEPKGKPAPYDLLHEEGGWNLQ